MHVEHSHKLCKSLGKSPRCKMIWKKKFRTEGRRKFCSHLLLHGCCSNYPWKISPQSRKWKVYTACNGLEIEDEMFICFMLNDWQAYFIASVLCDQVYWLTRRTNRDWLRDEPQSFFYAGGHSKTLACDRTLWESLRTSPWVRFIHEIKKGNRYYRRGSVAGYNWRISLGALTD